ncbi:lipocalin family protein [Chitinophaga horti]|uniref:Lipocalin family protein n=1 Tax=Chitinophaga horti TaxID=2920382 RepID=A0ABY6J347_9BACT|nr:lipocalin family protein [Chitinophaga horti]UYQ92771.1 lipocalin family protein [Chitinophaga horti]
MKNRLLAIAMVSVTACQQPVQDKSYLPDDMTTGKDSIFTEPTVSFKDTLPKLDSVPIGKIPGQWMQPVQGIDSLTQGFILKKNGQAQALNHLSPVYEKWELTKDTLILWSLQESDTAKTAMPDTLLVRAITDSSLLLFPINAEPGYLEKFTKGKEKIKKVPKR